MGDKQRARVEESLHQLIAGLLVRRVKDPRVANVSITRVKMSKDYTLAKVLYNIIGGSDNLPDVEAGLQSCSGFIRNQIRGHMRLRVIPELVFIYDASLDRAMEIESLIQTIHDEEKEREEDGDERRDIRE
ncbi:MAG TPA: 30S ribosome-binding factor RbfA [Patescibacteria group bacterium]|nr:30S ribosome-binding factor RbfA [Patescibacteria group bacterium]